MFDLEINCNKSCPCPLVFLPFLILFFEKRIFINLSIVGCSCTLTNVYGECANLNTDIIFFVLQNSMCLTKPSMSIDQINIIDIFTEEEIMKHVALHGPVAVAINANRNFYAYKSGML